MKVFGYLAAMAVGILAAKAVSIRFPTAAVEAPEPLLAYFDGLIKHDGEKVWDNQSPSLIEAMACNHPPIDRAVFIRGFENGFSNLEFLQPTVRGGYSNDDGGAFIVSIVVQMNGEEAERVYLVSTDENGFVKSINN